MVYSGALLQNYSSVSEMGICNFNIDAKGIKITIVC